MVKLVVETGLAVSCVDHVVEIHETRTLKMRKSVSKNIFGDAKSFTVGQNSDKTQLKSGRCLDICCCSCNVSPSLMDLHSLIPAWVSLVSVSVFF